MNKLKEYLRVTYQSWIAIFVTTVGFVGSLIVFIPEFSLESGYSKIVALVFCVVLSVIFTLIAKPIKDVVENLTVDDIVFDSTSASKILFPYEERFLKPINVIANRYYGNSNPDLYILKQWYEKNPYCLITLADNHNSIIGYYDILPLEEKFAKNIIAGNVTESDINSTVILSPSR